MATDLAPKVGREINVQGTLPLHHRNGVGPFFCLPVVRLIQLAQRSNISQMGASCEEALKRWQALPRASTTAPSYVVALLKYLCV